MKKIRSVFLLFIMLVGLCGCNNNEEATVVDTPNTTTTIEDVTDEITIEDVTTEAIEIEEATNSDASGEFDYDNPLANLPEWAETWEYNGANVTYYHLVDDAFVEHRYIWDNNAKIKMEVSPWIWYDPDTFIDTWPSDNIVESGKSYCNATNEYQLLISNSTYGEIKVIDFASKEESWYEENIEVNNEAFFIASKEEFLSFFNSMFGSEYDATSYDYDVVETLPNGDRVRTIQVNDTTSTIEGQSFVGYVRMIMPADASHCYFIFYGENPLNNTNAASDTLRCINSVQVFE